MLAVIPRIRVTRNVPRTTSHTVTFVYDIRAARGSNARSARREQQAGVVGENEEMRREYDVRY